MNGVEGALARHAEDVLAGLGADDLSLVRSILLRMVTPERTRRTITMDQVLDGLGDDAQKILERLTASRLVTVGRGDLTQGDRTCLELAHESLVHRWQTLSRWIDESRDDIGFLQAAKQLLDFGHNEVVARTKSGKVMLSKRPFDLHNVATNRFLKISVSLLMPVVASNSRHRRRQALRFGIPTLLAIIALVLGLQKREANFQRDEARSQRIEALREGALAALERETHWRRGPS